MSTLNSPDDPRLSVPSPMENGIYRSVPLAAVILGFATVAMLWTSMPDTVPIHYKLDGEPDGFGSKWILWIIPVINLGMFYLLGKAPNFDVRNFNYPVPVTEKNAAIQHRIALELIAHVRLIICILLAYVAYSSAKGASGDQQGFEPNIFWGLMVLLFLVIAVDIFRAFRAR